MPALLLALLWTIAPNAGFVGAADAPAAKPGPDNVPAPKDVAELRAIETRVQAVVAKVLPCVVNVVVGPSQGSGVVVSKDGLVMTAGHVVGKPGQQVTFRFADGKTAKGTTLGTYPRADAGLMKITDKGEWPFVEKGKSGDLKLGTWCVTVGHPLGYQPGRPPVVRIGRVLRVDPNTVQTDSPIVSGDSGGPCFDLDAKVIGINSSIGPPSDHNLHAAADAFTEHWEQMLKGEVQPPVGRESEQVKAAFRTPVAEAQRCVVRVKCDGKETVLGTIVGPDGWVLTKASELSGKLICRLPDQRELEARTVGIHPGFDLAMLKVEAANLPALAWAGQDPAVGGWVATAGAGDVPLAIGVVSVPRRTIPPTSGAIGVLLAEGPGAPLIESLNPGSPAEKAGLKPKDQITHVDGQPVKDRAEAQAAIKRHRLGEKVKVTYKRGTESKELEVEVARVETPGTRRRDMQNRVMTVGVSRRADDFPKVLQHDTVLKPGDCGGPVVDLNGKVVGVNIAHAGRTETYCVPSDVLLTLMYDLMSGRLAPPPPPKPAEKPPEVKPQVKPEAKPEVKPEVKPEPKPEVKPEPKPEVKPEPKPEVKPEPKPEVKPEPKPEVKPEPKPPTPAPQPKPPEPKPEVKPEAKPELKPEPKPEVKPEPKPPTPAPQPKPPEPKPEAKPAPKPGEQPTAPKPEAKPAEKAPEAKKP
jgi:serine protease Do